MGITQIAGTAHGLVCFRAAIPILESNDIFEFRGRDFEDIAVFEGRHPVHRAGCDVDTVARRHLTRDALAVLFDLELNSARPEQNRFVLDVVILQAQCVSGVDVDDPADIPVRGGPAQFVSPGFVYSHLVSYPCLSAWRLFTRARRRDGAYATVLL